MVFESRPLVTPKGKCFLLLRMSSCSLLPWNSKLPGGPLGRAAEVQTFSKPQSCLSAHLLAFLFLVALPEQLLPGSPKQRLPSGTSCLAPKIGLWLHLSHCRLGLEFAAGEATVGTLCQAAEALGTQHHIS